ncbi:MAG: VCBS repeat-containing protein [Bacteroidetes bacterium]|nr:VCBS repeat-containing protein [Bacteroidota bacterium]MCH8247680.1 VCBS repeat-containing protein [Bacteroidota bacterium]
MPGRLSRLLSLFAVLPVLAGCASSGNLVSESSRQYVREIESFVIEDESGLPYDLPLLGGLNVPRPQMHDIDADGDIDLFVQEETGSVIFLENTGTASEPRYVWRTDRYQDLDVGEWYRMLDLDGDGDIDMLAEERFSHIRYFRNEGTVEKAKFVLVVDTLRDANGVPIFADRQNIPNLTDIDCDGLVDLFIGRITGTITRYESIGMDANNVPQFKFVTDNFEDIEIIGELQTRHGANTMEFGDLDGDGDDDLLWGDFFEPGLLFIRNLGSCGLPSMRGEPEPFPGRNPVETSGYNAPIMVDVDMDGDLDVLFGVLGGAFNANFTTSDNFYYLEQTDKNVFEHRTSRYLRTVDVGSESVVKFADFDADGDQDLLIANKIAPADHNVSTVYYFENIGSASAPHFRAMGTMDLLATYHQNPAIADLDADGDLDMLIGKWNREIAYFRNEGTASNPNFILVDPVYISLTRGSNSAPTLGDIDGDGDYDLFVGEASGTINYYRNDGTPEEPNFVLVSDEFDGIDIGRRSYPTLVDIDDDGDLDLVIGSELEGLRLFRNNGSRTEAMFEDDGIIDVHVPVLATPEFVDIDGDGDLDLFMGGVSGGIIFYRNR